MKEFSCGSVVPGCNAKFTGETEDQILSQVAEHAAADHGIAAVTPDLIAGVRENISETV